MVIFWFVLTGVFGPLFGKLSSVQENNNSSFLPKGAEATQASEVIQTFSGKDSFSFPTLVLFEGAASPSALAAINDHLDEIGALTLAGQMPRFQILSRQGSEFLPFRQKMAKQFWPIFR